MILWSVLFTNAEMRKAVGYRSCRVAAPNKDIAVVLVGSALDINIAHDRSVLVVPAGNIDSEAQVISFYSEQV